jgi:hypothetical protein
MTDPDRSPLAGGGLQGFIGRLRFPQLLALFGILLAVDIAIPDAIPFLDEIFLALLTALFASLRRRKPEPPPEPPLKNVTPRR